MKPLTKCDRRGIPYMVQSFRRFTIFDSSIVVTGFQESTLFQKSYKYYEVRLFNGARIKISSNLIPISTNLTGDDKDKFTFFQLNSYIEIRFKEIMLDYNLDRIFKGLKRSINNEIKSNL